MLNKFKILRQDESGAAMITALLFVIIMLLVTTSISITAIAGLQKSQDARDKAGMEVTVGSAVSNAVAFANNPASGRDLEDHLGFDNAVYGVSTATSDTLIDGRYKWLWYYERVNDAVVGESYDIVAKSYVSQPDDISSRTVRVRLQSTPVKGARYLDNGRIIYAPIPMGAFSWGLLGVKNVTLNGNASVRSFNSAYVSDPVIADDTKNGTISTNDTIALNGTNTASLKQIYLLQGNSENIPVDRCTTTANCLNKIKSYAYGVELVSIANKVVDSCPLNANQYTDWKASEHDGILNSETDGTCFNNIIFDVNTELALGYSSGNPVELNIAGNITVNAGVKVNQNELRGGPLALRIYSAAGNSAKFNSGPSTINPTKFAGMVAGYNFHCTDSGATGKSLIIEGSLACDRVTFGEGTQVWWDQQTVQVLGAESDRSILTIWTPTSYQLEYNN